MISSNKFAIDLCGALELDMTRIRSITIKMEASKPVEIQVERFMSELEGDQLVSQLSSFVLTDKAEQ